MANLYFRKAPGGAGDSPGLMTADEPSRATGFAPCWVGLTESVVTG